MPKKSKPWYETIVSPLKRAFARHEYLAAKREELGGYQYDESDFFVCKGYSLVDHFDPKKGRSRDGFIGEAQFSYVQEPMLLGLPFAVDKSGRRIKGDFVLDYEDLSFRIKALQENGIRPTETLRALRGLERDMEIKRRLAGCDRAGGVIEFPEKAV